MKKTEKVALCEILIDYLDDRQLQIKSDYSHKYSLVPKTAQFKNHYDTDISNFISSYKMDSFNYPHDVYEFAVHLLSSVKHQHLALHFLLAKEVTVKSDDYEHYVTGMEQTLQAYPEFYFEFLNRAKFLESNLRNLDLFLPHIPEQEKREIIIDKCFSLKTFQSLDSQASLYKTIQETIDGKSKYDEFFPTISKINMEDHLFSESKKQETISYQLNYDTLNAFNLHKKYGMERLRDRLELLMKRVNEQITDLPNVSHVRYHEYSGYAEVNFYGTHLDKSRIDFFVDTLLKKKLSQSEDYNRDTPDEMLITDSIKEENTHYLFENLSENVSMKTQHKKQKI